ncbi:unnamed protein product [Malassezia sympodialis ATCC 42132]|uniref:uncharacterized protein n=1 Tax=Malassezia sympodialis (strain ATCC 42132) TaxID=1230383 RepID=UPI0002C270D5|nr:uncharacterized protein MSY001_2107 [Malassezia sympodialis ATCC 42132]CCU99401.1 unnamed protein product [Malassezia sympodialis ATCC 42132]|eukprot:XP_018740652.1 uncharacterized protein MSY001_2107 [Malassezia sympodialis ATCC 42132]
MGASESKPEGENLVLPNSLACTFCFIAKPSEPFFDFCIGINGLPLSDLGINVSQGSTGPSNNTHARWSMVEAHEGRTIVLNVWNSKQQEFRGTYT